MSVPLDDFWKLTAESQLIPVEKYRELRVRFRHLRGAAGRANARAAASWLVNQKVLTTYQAQVLLAGRSGPFTFGDYRIRNRLLGPLGARRFEGLHLPTNHRVLVHFWPYEADQWPMALSVAQQHCSLTHPNLDRCYEAIEAAGQRIAVAEDVEGTTVSERLKSKQPPVLDAIRIAHQIALALQQIHNSQLVHGFVMSDEILVASSGHAKLRRYPIARLTALHADAPDPKQRLLRQADYLAPELFRSNQPPGPLTDIYALGCTLYELLKGRAPFAGGNLSEKIERHASERIESMDDLPSIPEGLSEVVSFMMAKKQSLRYQSAAEVAQKLESFLGSAAHTTPPRHKATEPYYLVHINKQAKQIPKHLQSPTQAKVNPPPISVRPAAPDANAQVATTETTTTTVEARDAVRVESNAASAGSRTARTLIRPLTVGSAAVVAIVCVWGLVASFSRGPANVDAPPEKTIVTPNSKQTSDAVAKDEQDDEFEASDTVADDGQALWASPTAGSPITIEYTPPASQCFIHVRPRNLLQATEGPAVLKALGPKFEALQDQLVRNLGFSLDQIDRLLVALVPQDTGPPRATLVMRLGQDSVNVLAARAKTTEQSDGGRRLMLGSMQLYLPTASPNVVVTASDPDIQAVIEQNGQPPLLQRQVEQLRLMTDDNRHLTVFLDPHFLAADGRDTFVAEYAQLREPILTFLGDQIEAASLSVHLDRTFFGELQLSSTLDQDPYSLAAACKSRLQALPEEINSLLGRIVIERFWQPLAVRFPLMINFLHQQTRIGVSDQCAIVNFVMPEHAAHNLMLASVLAVEASTLSRGEPITPATQTLGWDKILAQQIDFEIPQQSLEFTMVELATSVDRALPTAQFKIVIIGADLQLAGITRNQQIRDVNLRNQSVNEILTELVKRANPTPAASITSPEQKLVWVPDRQGLASGKTVFITTREAATQKGYSLPKQFLENSQEP